MWGAYPVIWENDESGIRSVGTYILPWHAEDLTSLEATSASFLSHARATFISRPGRDNQDPDHPRTRMIKMIPNQWASRTDYHCAHHFSLGSGCSLYRSSTKLAFCLQGCWRYAGERIINIRDAVCFFGITLHDLGIKAAKWIGFKVKYYTPDTGPVVNLKNTVRGPVSIWPFNQF